MMASQYLVFRQFLPPYIAVFIKFLQLLLLAASVHFSNAVLIVLDTLFLAQILYSLHKNGLVVHDCKLSSHEECH
jgi:hypothetical protein